MRMRELAKVLRSKNAQPFYTTLDILFATDEPYQRVRGIVLTRFHEPHLDVPPKFEHVAIEGLSQVFGKPNHFEIHKTKMRFRIGEEMLSKLEKEFALKEEHKRFGLR